MFKKLAILFFGISMYNTAFATEDLNNLLETRKIVHGSHSVDLVVPKGFTIDQDVLEDSMVHSEQYNQNAEETLKEVVTYALETEFWNSIQRKNEQESILYLYCAVKNGAPVLIESFRYTLTDIEPQIINEISEHNIQDQSARQKMDHVVNILGTSY
jgi:hypothetical protein